MQCLEGRRPAWPNNTSKYDVDERSCFCFVFDPQAAAEAYDAILDEQLDLVGAELLLKRARCHFALGRWLQAAADAGRAAKAAAEGDDDQVTTNSLIME